MKRILVAALLAASLAVPAGASAFTSQQTNGMRALCQVFVTRTPPGYRLTLSQWRSACVYFSR